MNGAAAMVTSMEVEYDSDEELQDLGSELNTWLTQLNQVSKKERNNLNMNNNGTLLTQSHTMESFRCSVIMDLDEEGGGNNDLDDIINDLCALEAELSDAQKELNGQTPQTDGDSGNVEDIFTPPPIVNQNGAAHPYSLKNQTKSQSQPQIHVISIPSHKTLSLRRPQAKEPADFKRQASEPLMRQETHNQPRNGAADDADQKAKEEKIRLAIQKIKAADIKKLFVKVFIQNGECKTILVDEKMTIHDVIMMLYEKCEVKPNVRWTIVEQVPDLYMERIVEDHEKLLSVMMNWLKISNNKILFLETDDKYDLFFQPQKYLLHKEYADKCYEKEQKALLDDLFGGGNAKVPEVEGEIFYKVDGQKTWKKMHAVLRSSGLYSRKGKSTKGLHCIVQFAQVEIYRGFGWRKKYRAPTEHCFALKSPKIQRKSKEIRYFCCEDEYTLKKWLMGMRIAKYGTLLHTGFKHMLDVVSNKVKGSPNSTDTPSDSMSQSSRDSGFSVTSDSSNSLDLAQANSRKQGKDQTMPPPPEEFSDLPPPPPELLREEPTPTNTPVHFVSNLTDDFQRFHTKSPDCLSGSSTRSSSNSSLSTPRNSVTSSSGSTSTPTQQKFERHSGIRNSLRKGQTPTPPKLVAPPKVPQKQNTKRVQIIEQPIYERPPNQQPACSAVGHYGAQFKQHANASSFSLAPRVPAQTEFLKQLGQVYAMRTGNGQISSETESDSDIEELPPPPPELLGDAVENPYDVPFNQSNADFIPPPPLEYNPYSDHPKGSAESYNMGRVFACQTGTIKRAPPPVPKRNDGTLLSNDPRQC